MIKQVTAEEFKAEVGKGLVMAEFFSSTCGPCKMLGFVLKDVLKDVGEDFTILQIDFDVNKDVTEEYEVTGYPTMILLQDGEELERLQGLQQKPLIVKMIQKHQI